MTERHRHRYRRRVLHPVQDGPQPRYVYVSGDSLAEIDAIRVTYALQRKQIEKGTLDPEPILQAMERAEQKKQPLPLSALAARYLEAERPIARKTRENVVTFLRVPGRSLARRDWRELKPAMLKEWIDALLARGLSLGYVQLQWRILRSIIAFAVEVEAIPRCPWDVWSPKFRGGRRAKPGEAARNVGELVLLINAARRLDDYRRTHRYGNGPPTYNLEARIACAALLGLHQGELAGLRWPDVDAVAQTIAIVRQYDGQALKTTARAAQLAAAPELFEILFRHALRLSEMELFDPAGPIFPALGRSTPGHPRPQRPGGDVITWAEMRNVVKRAGLPNPRDWTVTSLRRSFAILEYTASHDVIATAERTRHASPANLLKYLRKRVRGVAQPGFTLSDALTQRAVELPQGPTIAALPAASGDDE